MLGDITPTEQNMHPTVCFGCGCCRHSLEGRVEGCDTVACTLRVAAISPMLDMDIDQTLRPKT